jgi:hypothetical protein
MKDEISTEELIASAKAASKQEVERANGIYGVCIYR